MGEGAGVGRDKGSHCCGDRSAATGEREGSGNLKVKMQITQPGDGARMGWGQGREEEGERQRGGSRWGRGRWQRGVQGGTGYTPKHTPRPVPVCRESRRQKIKAPLVPYWRQPGPGGRGAISRVSWVAGRAEGGCRVRLAATRRAGDFIAMGR